jgi:hypothetical protein
MDIVISKSCVVRPHATSPNVLVVFSAVDIPQGEFLGFKKVFFPDRFNATIIFVNDISKKWYVNGIPGLGDDLESTLVTLAQLVETHRKPGGVVVAYGNSMGAYGALLYGCRLGFQAAVALGVEVLVKNPVGISRFYLKDVDRRPDVRAAVASSTTFCHLVAGEMFLGDIIGLYRLTDLPNVHIETVENFEHGVSAYVHLTKKIDEFLNAYLDMAARGDIKPLSLVEPESQGRIAQEKRIGVYLYASQILLERRSDKQKGRVAKLIKLISTATSPVLMSYVNYMISQLYLRQGNRLAAKLYATKAYQQNKSSPHITQFLSTLAYDEGDVELCHAWSRKSVQLRQRFPVTLYKNNKCYPEYVESLQKLGMPDIGAQHAQQFLAFKHVPEKEALLAALDKCKQAMRG